MTRLHIISSTKELKKRPQINVLMVRYSCQILRAEDNQHDTLSDSALVMWKIKQRKEQQSMQMALGDISTLKEAESNSHLLQIFELNNSSVHFLIFDLVYHTLTFILHKFRNEKCISYVYVASTFSIPK